MLVESSKVKSFGYYFYSPCLSWECFRFQTATNCQSIFQKLPHSETSVMLNWFLHSSSFHFFSLTFALSLCESISSSNLVSYVLPFSCT